MLWMFSTGLLKRTFYQKGRNSSVTPTHSKGLLPVLRLGSGPRGGAAEYGPYANFVGMFFFGPLAVKAGFRPIMGSQGTGLLPALRLGSGPRGAAGHRPLCQLRWHVLFWSVAMKAAFGRSCVQGNGIASRAALGKRPKGGGCRSRPLCQLRWHVLFWSVAMKASFRPILCSRERDCFPRCAWEAAQGGGCRSRPLCQLRWHVLFWSVAMKASFRPKTKKAPHTLCEGLVLCGPDGTRTFL